MSFYSGLLKQRFSPLIVVLILFLVSCGGGGGGGASDLGGGNPNVNIDCGTVDSDSDGLPDCYELAIGTSTVDQDTDGDNLSDFEEVVTKAFDADTNNFQFNPLIADVPKLSFELSSVPDITINYTEGTAQTISNTDTMSSETATTVSSSQTTTESLGVEVSETGTAEFSLDNFGGSYSATVTENWEQSLSWTKSQSLENRRAYSRATTATTSKSVTNTSGQIAVTLKVKNRGFQVVTLTNLSLAALQTDPRNPSAISPIGNLDFDTSLGAFPEIDIEPNRSTSSNLIFQRQLSLSKALDLLKNSDNLILEASTWQAKDVDGRSFTQSLTNIGAKDVSVIIDYGPRAEREDGLLKESYFVSTVADFNNKQITAEHAFNNILKIPFTTGTTQWKTGLTQNGILSVRGVGTDAANNGHWTVLYVYNTDNGATRTFDYYDNLDAAYDFNNIVLRKGYVLHLIYIEDVDGDGIASREEFMHGTSDSMTDTDGDGLSDFDELKTGWEIPLTSAMSRKVYSDPLEQDADDDGLIDADEMTNGTDPYNSDTNGNGVKDNADGALVATQMHEQLHLTLNNDLLDVSGNDRHGVMAGVPGFGRDRFDNLSSALYLDGTPDATGTMEIVSAFDASDENGGAWSFWLRPEVIRSQGILAHQEINSAAKLWMYPGDLVAQGNLGDPAFINDVVTDTSSWYHVIGIMVDSDNVAGADTFRLYVDGQLVTGFSDKCCMTLGSNTWKFGAGSNDTPRIPDGLVVDRFQGYIDDIRIFGRSLNFDEVQALFNEPAP